MTASLQLYSMRNGEDFATLLPKLPALGITKVEAYGAVFEAPDAFVRAVKDSGLEMPGCHMGLDYIQSDPSAAVAMAQTLGAKQVFVPYLDAAQRPTDAAGYAAFAKEVFATGAPFRDAGITFGWHNHDFELRALDDGSIPLDVMFEAAPELSWEGDLAWVIVGGGDPLTYINKYSAQLAAIHVKDIAPNGENLDEDGWADLGQGTVDWTALIAACRRLPQRIEYVLEHDNPSDPMRYATTSAAAFAKIWENTNV